MTRYIVVIVLALSLIVQPSERWCDLRAGVPERVQYSVYQFFDTGDGAWLERAGFVPWYNSTGQARWSYGSLWCGEYRLP